MGPIFTPRSYYEHNSYSDYFLVSIVFFPVFASLLIYVDNQYVTGMVPYFVVSITYIPILSYVIIKDRIIYLSKNPIPYLLIIGYMSFIVIGSFFVSTSLELFSIFRIIGYPLFGIFNIFIISKYFWRLKIYQLIAIFGLLIVCPAIYVSLFGQFEIAGLTFHSYARGYEIAGYTISGTRSIFFDPNYFGIFCMICSALSLRCLKETHNHQYGWIVIVSIYYFGIVLSFSRAAALGSAIFTVGYFFRDIIEIISRNRQVFIILVVFFLLLMSFLFPAVESFIQASKGISSRGVKWFAGISSVLKQPYGYGTIPTTEVMGEIIGSEVSVHSSYLNAFILSGIVGGLSYLFLFLYSILLSIRKQFIGNFYTWFLLMFSIHQIFQTYMVGGLGFFPLIVSFTIGWIVTYGGRK